MSNADMLNLLERAMVFVRVEAVALGHDVRWFKPRAIHGFAYTHGKCARCGARPTVWRHSSVIKADDLAACPGRKP